MIKLILLATLCIICNANVNLNDLTWTEQTYPWFLNADGMLAAAAYNDTIYLFGGINHPTQVTEFNIASQYFIDQDGSLSNDVRGTSQYWTQIDKIMYWVDDATDYIIRYDLTTKQSEMLPANDIPLRETCLTSSTMYLFMIGGWKVFNSTYAQAVDAFQIYNISSQRWLNGPPLQTARNAFSCVVYAAHNTIYAIAGSADVYSNELYSNELKSVEKININNVINNEWQYLNDELPKTLQYHRSIMYTDLILTFGGESASYNEVPTTDIFVIEAQTDFIQSTSVSSLAYAVKYYALISFNNVIYLFGGMDAQGSFFNKWQYSVVPTQPQTRNPTTVLPTSTTVGPTNTPTTKNPTLDSTLNPSNSPTKFPTKTTKSPSSSPTISPSGAPTMSPTLSAETMQYLQDLDDLEYLYQITVISFASLFGMISFFAWLDSTKQCRTNDYFKINQISAAAFQALDMYSDCFFAVNLSIQNKLNSKYSIALIFSIIFIVIPASLTIAQLYYHSQKHWVYSSDKVRGWMAKRAKALYLLSILTGNAFAAVSLVNSYMFQLSFFDMGLTDKEISAFNYKRVHTVILFENLPQLGIQAWYLFTFGSFDDPITMSSMLFSSISIIVSALGISVEKSLSQTEGHVTITLHVTGNDVMMHKKHCKTRKEKLEKKLAELIPVDPSRVQVIKPLDIKHGFEVNVNFYFLDVNKTPIDYYKILVDEQNSGQLHTTFKEGWKLDAEPIVDIISHVRRQSKNKRRRSEKTQEAETYSLQMATLKSKNKDPTDKSTSLIDRTNAGEQINAKHQAVSRNDDEGNQE